jgi:transposase InsO family protein
MASTKKQACRKKAYQKISFDRKLSIIEGQGMILSTTEKYDPYENAVAERINGILKYEFGLIKIIPTIEVAQKMVAQAATIYNNERRHCSLQCRHRHLHTGIKNMTTNSTKNW